MGSHVPKLSFADAHDEPACGARGPFTVRGRCQVIACVTAMREVLGDRVGLPPDCGWTPPGPVGLVRRPGWCLPRLENLPSGADVSAVSATSYQRISRGMTGPSTAVNNKETTS